MSRNRPAHVPRRIWRVGTAVAVLLVPLALGPSTAALAKTVSCGSPAGKCDLVAVRLTSGSAATTFTVTLTNEATTQQLGSAQVTVPAGLGSPTQMACTTSNSPTACAPTLIGSSTIQILDLGLGFGDTATVTGTLVAASCGVYAWSAAVKQSNDFSGSGNAFTQDPASVLTTVVTHGCRLAFAAQPADAQRGAGISSMTGNPSGPPITVAVENTAGTVVPITGLAITLSLATSCTQLPAGDSLAGTVSATTVAGAASFADPSISASAQEYCLEASAAAPEVAPATSTPFNIDDVLTLCPSGTCFASDPSPSSGTIGSVTAGSVVPGTPLAISIGVEGVSCSGYTVTSGVVTYDIADPSVVSIEIAKAVVDESPNNGASFYQVCFDSSAAPSSDAGTLLPDCSATTPAPCVVARTKTRAGDVIVTFSSPGGVDPRAGV